MTDNGLLEYRRRQKDICKLKIKEDANLIWHTQRLGLISDGLLWMTKKPWIKTMLRKSVYSPKAFPSDLVL